MLVRHLANPAVTLQHGTPLEDRGIAKFGDWGICSQLSRLRPYPSRGNSTSAQLPHYTIKMFPAGTCGWTSLPGHLTRHSRPLTISHMSLSIKHLVLSP